MKNNIAKVTVLAAIIGASFQCVSADFTQQNMSLNSLQSMDNKNSTVLLKEAGIGVDDTTQMRLKAMKEAAMAAGAQHGYVDHMNELKTAISRDDAALDDLYDFSVLMRLASGVDNDLYMLPPVINESNNVVATSDDSRRMRISNRMYVIEKPERLVTAAPNWRQYLLFDQAIEVVSPPNVLLPRDNNEKKYWSEWVQSGWIQGVNQAEREMTYRVRQLGNDFVGMTRYMRLVTDGKISKPVVVSSHQNVIGKDNEMREGEKVIQISVPARLNPNASKWDTIEMSNRDSLRYPTEAKR
ncbi:hypothetical protein D3C87_351530 [compost metagenome]